MHEWYYGGFWFLGWIIFMVIFFSFTSRLLWWRGGSRRGWYHDEKDAVAYLNERYAKGEITKEEYVSMKKDITSTQNFN